MLRGAGQMDNIPVKGLTEENARAELARLATLMNEAELAYYQADSPVIDDAAYDALKARNQAIEDQFPALKRLDSPSGRVGAAPASGFGKIRHEVPMLSLGNAFADSDVDEFDARVRKFLSKTGAIGYTAEPKIDGLSLSIRYEQGALVYAATRGDGEVGEDVLAVELAVAHLPPGGDLDLGLVHVRTPGSRA